jgi:hypothetical protein
MQDDIKKPAQEVAVKEPPLEPVEPPAPEPSGPPEASGPKPDDAQSEPPPPQPEAPKKPEHESEHHLIPLVLAIIIFVFLVTVAIIADRSKPDIQDNNGSPLNTQTQSPAAQLAPATDPADQKTIDDSINAINSLSNDDDTSGQSLNDQSLGL